MRHLFSEKHIRINALEEWRAGRLFFLGPDSPNSDAQIAESHGGFVGRQAELTLTTLFGQLTISDGNSSIAIPPPTALNRVRLMDQRSAFMA